jgi:hypothetical protein
MVRDKGKIEREAFYETYSLMHFTKAYIRDVDSIISVPSEYKPVLLRALMGLWVEVMRALGEDEDEEHALYNAMKTVFSRGFIDKHLREVAVLDMHRDILGYIKSRTRRATRPG